MAETTREPAVCGLFRSGVVMGMGIQDELLSLFDHAYGRASDRLEGLTDDEYSWEPTPDCWTVRPGGVDGDGDGVLLEDPPVTTIGWRLCHVSDAVARHPMNGFLHPGFVASERQHPTSAAAGIAYLASSYGEWRRLLERVDDDIWLAPLGAAAGPFAEATPLGVALHNADEFVHHTAEIALLRDLYIRQLHS